MGLNPVANSFLEMSAAGVDIESINPKKLQEFIDVGYVVKKEDGSFERNDNRVYEDVKIETDFIYKMSKQIISETKITRKSIVDWCEFAKSEIEANENYKDFMDRIGVDIQDIVGTALNEAFKRDEDFALRLNETFTKNNTPDQKSVEIPTKEISTGTKPIESIMENIKKLVEEQNEKSSPSETEKAEAMAALEEFFDNTFQNEDIEYFSEINSEMKESEFLEPNNKDTIQYDEEQQLNNDDYETPQIESKQSWIERMQESKNPFARAISKGLMRISGRGKKALPEPQLQQEASTKPRSFDSDTTGFDITDSDMFPTKGMAFKKTIQKLFSNKKNIEPERIPLQTIKPLNAKDFNSRISVSEEQLNGNPEIKIPASININKKATNAEQKAQEDHDDEPMI